MREILKCHSECFCEGKRGTYLLKWVIFTLFFPYSMLGPFLIVAGELEFTSLLVDGKSI